MFEDPDSSIGPAVAFLAALEIEAFDSIIQVPIRQLKYANVRNSKHRTFRSMVDAKPIGMQRQ